MKTLEAVKAQDAKMYCRLERDHIRRTGRSGYGIHPVITTLQLRVGFDPINYRVAYQYI